MQDGQQLKLVVIIASDADADKLMKKLVEQGYPATKIGSTGGFLRKGKIKGRYDRLAQTGNAASSTALVYLWAVIGLLVVVAAAAWIAKA